MSKRSVPPTPAKNKPTEITPGPKPIDEQPAFLDVEDLLVRFDLLELAISGLSSIAENSVLEHERHLRPVALYTWDLRDELEALGKRLAPRPAKAA